DTRSDLYAVGLVLWELLTGRRAIDPGSTLDPGPPRIPPPSQLSPQLPPEVDALVLTALAPHPDERYASAEAVAGRLTTLLSAAQDAARVKAFLEEIFEVEAAREAAEGRAPPRLAEHWARTGAAERGATPVPVVDQAPAPGAAAAAHAP